MQQRRRDEPRLAVVDVETTGFSRHDRIVEFACVTVVEGTVIDEYETLIQPERDPGPVHVHGITPEMLQSAPPFESVADDIANRLDGAVLVAHNISYDMRMLRQEVARLASVNFDPGRGLCTYKLTKQKLALAAAAAGLPEPNHTALADARTVAALVDLHAPSGGLRHLHTASWAPTAAGSGITVRRPGAPPRRGSLHQLAARTRWPPTSQESAAVYLDALDRCLDDGVLEVHERHWLDDTAGALRLSVEERTRLHGQYFELLKQQILADGMVTQQEQELAEKIAVALSLGPTGLQAALSAPDRVALTAGMNVCFTGTSVVDGTPVSKKTLEEIAIQAGMRPMKTLTNKCHVLVAADPMSRSGKARQARERSIPIISVEDFIEATRGV